MSMYRGDAVDRSWLAVGFAAIALWAPVRFLTPTLTGWVLLEYTLLLIAVGALVRAITIGRARDVDRPDFIPPLWSGKRARRLYTQPQKVLREMVGSAVVMILLTTLVVSWEDEDRGPEFVLVVGTAGICVHSFIYGRRALRAKRMHDGHQT